MERSCAVARGKDINIQHYTAWGHQRTVGIPAGGGRADTPAGGGQVGIPAGATLRMGMHAHATGMGEGGH